MTTSKEYRDNPITSLSAKIDTGKIRQAVDSASLLTQELLRRVDKCLENTSQRNTKRITI